MGEVVNLRRARKRQTHAKAQAEATANRVTFGLSKIAREQAAAERALTERRLDGRLRRDPGDAE